MFFLLLLLHCFIFILVLLLCYVYRSSLYCNIPSDLCTLCLRCHYFYIVLSLYVYCCYVTYPDHHFTVIYLQTCVVCVCLVSRSSLYCNIPSLVYSLYCFIFIYIVVIFTACTVVCYYFIHCFIFISDLCTVCYVYVIIQIITLLYVMYPDHHFTVIYLQTCVVCVCLVIQIHFTVIYLQTCVLCVLLLHCFIFMLVLLLCYVYCNIPSDLCSHHFTVIYLQTCVLYVLSFIVLLYC